MLDFAELDSDLASLGLGHWQAPLQRLLAERFSDAAHGKFSEWRQIIADLPAERAASITLDKGAIALSCPAEVCSQSRDLLLSLAPWRKGPFELGNIRIDAEWQSDLKWQRLADRIEPLAGRAVLDIGCGNGYYALRMWLAGARVVIGVDPTLLFIMQHLALRRFMPPLPIHLLPLRLHELPQAVDVFDSVFSMGVLYHQREPGDHLAQIRATLRPGGQLVLETLILPGTAQKTLTLPDRYARMRNVWSLPTISRLEEWVADAGFNEINVADISQTTTAEQRTTQWMPFESLQDALDPSNPSLTVEGWPAPRRAVVLCRRK